MLSTQIGYRLSLSHLDPFAAAALVTQAMNMSHQVIHHHTIPNTPTPIYLGTTKSPQDLLLLLDSGAQFLDGTTDVTRTVRFMHLPCIYCGLQIIIRSKSNTKCNTQKT